MAHKSENIEQYSTMADTRNIKMMAKWAKVQIVDIQHRVKNHQTHTRSKTWSNIQQWQTRIALTLWHDKHKFKTQTFGTG